MIALVLHNFVDKAYEWFAVLFFSLLFITAITQWAIYCYKYIKRSLNEKDK